MAGEASCLGCLLVVFLAATPFAFPPGLGAWAAGSHRDNTQNVLTWADRVVGPQEALVGLIQLLLVGLFFVLGSCRRRNCWRNPDPTIT